MEGKGAQQCNVMFTISQEPTGLLFRVEETEIFPSAPGENFTLSRFPRLCQQLKIGDGLFANS